jgi:hypothetical protein
MKDSTKVWLSCSPLLLVGLAVLLSPLFKEFMARKQEAAMRSDPLTMQVDVMAPTEATSQYREKAGVDRLVFEIALLRLAMPAKGVSESISGSDYQIASSREGGSSSFTRANGKHSVSNKDVSNGSRQEFSGPGYRYVFDTKQGCLCIGDRRICIVDTPKLVVLGEDGSIASVTELNVPHPQLNGSASDVASLIAIAKNYAKMPPAEVLKEPTDK